MEENKDKKTAADGIYEARKEVMQTGTEGINNAEV